MKLLLAVMLLAQTIPSQTVGGGSGPLIVAGTNQVWTTMTYDISQKHSLQMHKETVQGNFVLMPLQTEDDSFAITVESKDELFTHILVTVFYRVNMKDRTTDKSTSLLLSKQDVIPAVMKAKVMTAPFYIPWSSVEFVRLAGFKQIEQQEFR